MTLIEMVITITILSIALVSITGVISASINRSANPLIQHKTVLLAQAYFDEILSKRFAEQTPVGGVPPATSADVCVVGSDMGETRRQFDDVDDYDSLDEMPPQLQSGVTLNGYSDYRVQITVICSGTSLGLTNNYDAKKITVTIDPPAMGEITFTAYQANY